MRHKQSKVGIMQETPPKNQPKNKAESTWKRHALGIVCLLGAIATAVLFVLDLKSGWLRRAVTSAITTIVLLGFFVQAFPPKDKGNANASGNTDASGSKGDDSNA